MDWSNDSPENSEDINHAPVLPELGGAAVRPVVIAQADLPYSGADHDGYEESDDGECNRGGDDEFHPDEYMDDYEDDDDGNGNEEDNGDGEEYASSDDASGDDDDYDDAIAKPVGKRKRYQSADKDYLLAKNLQSEYEVGAAGRSTRGVQKVVYAETSDDDDDEDEVEYAEESEDNLELEEDTKNKKEKLAAPAAAPAAIAVPAKVGTLKLKLRLPTPPTTTAAAAVAKERNYEPPTHQSATPSHQPFVERDSYSNAQAATDTAPASEQQKDGENDEYDDEEQEQQYLEWDDDEAAEAQEEAAKRRRRVAPVLLSQEELLTLDDEVERVIAHRDIQGAPPDPVDPWRTREFYVKWARFSYIHNSWDTHATLSQLGGFKRVLNYCRRMDAAAAARGFLTVEEVEEVDVRAEMEAEIEKEHSQVERIVAERCVHVEGGGPSVEASAAGDAAPLATEFLCKWKGLPYSEVTWEVAADVERIGAGPEVDEYRKREALALSPRVGVDAARRTFAQSGERAFTEQPSYLKGGGKLRDYQLEGLNWMVYNWARNVNGILADEMGLGKTVQCASMIGYLATVQEVGGPFIIVVPLSTVPNWAREFRKWIPQVNAVVYVGDTASREVIRHFEFPLTTAPPTPGRTFKLDVIITTYELALKDASILRNVRWAYLMVDEAHRLKNDESALYRELSQWTFRSKLLITGTPLQNNIRELWALLHFLQPAKFSSAEAFEAEYDLRDPAAVQKLHAVLRPHLLRRVIKDVEKSLPPKNERILRVPMTPLQRQYYRWILTRNFKELNKNSKGGQVKLLNIIVDLKKTCNHPFLFESARDNYKSTGDDVANRLVVTSGKMVLLDKLLRRLKATGHRVLIFSQMVRQLDIISEYMTLRGYRHQRLDGSTPAQKRHQAMERFNAPGSEDFAFLLSTRAGGLGINLATADTVLLFDSDWNPQNDLQAMSRAHRIGQKDIVNIYRLVTSGSVEEDILERAKKKMVLDQLVIQKMDTSGRTVLDAGAGSTAAGARMFDKNELAAILKFGAEDLFKEEDAAADGVASGASAGGLMTDEDLDAILERAEVVEQKEDAPGGASDLLSSFNVATFKADEDDAAFWNRLIPADMRPKDEPTGSAAELGMRTARLRALLETSIHDPHASQGAPAAGKVSKKKKKAAEPGPPVEGALLRIDKWPQEVDSVGRLTSGERALRPESFPKTLSKRDAASFLKAVKRHGLASKLDAIAEDAGGAVASANHDARRALWHGLLRACEKVVDMHSRRTLARDEGVGGAGGGNSGGAFSLAHNNNNNSSTVPAVAQGSSSKHPPPSESHLDFFGFDVKAAEILAFVRQMALVEGRLANLPDPVKRLRLSMAERPAPTAWMRGCGWTPEDDTALLVGAYRHGVGAWGAIAGDAELRLEQKLAGAGGKEGASLELPKASHLETRVMGLLRQIEKVAKRPPKAPSSRPARERAAPLQLSAAPEKSGARAAPPRPAAEVAALEAATRKAEAALGRDVLVFVRKLRTLQRRGVGMEPSLVVSKTRKYMAEIGRRIEEVATTASDRADLWSYVSRYTENAMSGDKLSHVYRRLSHHDHPGLAEELLPLVGEGDGRAGTAHHDDDTGGGGENLTKEEP